MLFVSPATRATGLQSAALWASFGASDTVDAAGLFFRPSLGLGGIAAARLKSNLRSRSMHGSLAPFQPEEHCLGQHCLLGCLRYSRTAGMSHRESALQLGWEFYVQLPPSEAVKTSVKLMQLD